MFDKPKLALGLGKTVKEVNTAQPLKIESAQQEEKRQEPMAKPVETKFGKPAEVTQTITLKGTSFSKYPFDELSTNQELVFVRDPNGIARGISHDDAYAISVQDKQGRHVGYIPKEAARIITVRILDTERYDYAVSVYKIKGGYQTEDGKELNWGVDIMLKVFRRPESST